MTNHLLIVDPQNDFCDLPPEMCPPDPVAPGAGRLAPQLPVTGAHDDMLRLADFVRRQVDRLDAISITLDSHHHIGIERPAFWRHADGRVVAPFTRITASALRRGEFRPVRQELQARVQRYLDRLEEAGRYTLMVWPAHCELGSWGHNVHAHVHQACNRWEERWTHPVDIVLKGLNPYTEHYSALQAEVPDPEDPRTLTNTVLLDSLRDARTILVGGEAGSHCVRATLEHLLRHLPPGPGRQYVLLRDCVSPVTGFEADYDAFLKAAAAAGVRVCRREDAAALL